MSLEEKVNGEIKTAMLAKDQAKLSALRAIKSGLLLLKSEKGGAQITEEMELKLLQRMVKQRKESAEMYKSQNRDDLYAEEVSQLEIISLYLPQQMGEEEITEALKKMMADNNITSIRDMGKLMGIASRTFAGKADNKLVSEIVKRLLS